MNTQHLKHTIAVCSTGQNVLLLKSNTKNAPTICYLINETIASFYYRCLLPSIYLTKYNIMITKKSNYKAIVNYHPKIILLQRAVSYQDFQLIQLLQKLPSTLVGVDYDDDFLTIHKTSPCYAMKIAYKKDIIEIYKQADFIITSTEYLKNRIKKYNGNTYVFENYTDLSAYPLNFIQTDVAYHSFLCSSNRTHEIDIKSSGLIKSIDKLKNAKVHFLFHGYSPTTKNKNIININACKLYHYFYALCHIEACYGLLPLADIQFNYSKSPIKYFEYVQAGKIPITNNNNNIYTKIIKHNENGYIVNSFTEITDINNSKREYKRIMKNANDFIQQNFDIRKNIYKLSDIFKKIKGGFNDKN